MPGQELERKFVLSAIPFELSAYPASQIRQGYLSIDPVGSEVRVRRRGERCSLTVKRGAGVAREEEELDLDEDELARLWPLTEGRRVEKTRYEIPASDGLVIELDVYAGPLEGLITAEIEFGSDAEAERFQMPHWLGREVTEDPAYKNHRLASDGLPD
ncbi:MAG: adenylate cyclase [Actinomycetota bacterium]|nr:adenylate cyclase [Actinomycetota bacterium]